MLDGRGNLVDKRGFASLQLSSQGKDREFVKGAFYPVFAPFNSPNK
jgi:hypothetical protein